MSRVRSAGDAGAAGSAGRWALSSLVAAAFLAGMALQPPLSDGDFSVYDGIGYAHLIEQVTDLRRDPLGVVTYPSHLLHHGLAFGLGRGLQALGLEQPTFVAGRLLSALGAALLVLLLGRLPRGRPLLGAGFALAVLAGRGVLLDASTGETMLPAMAALLWALVLACRRPVVRPAWVVTALVLALLLRQDNLAVVPGVALAVAAGLPRGRRLRGVLGVLFVAGLLTLLCYAGAWWLNPRGLDFPAWLLERGHRSTSILEDPAYDSRELLMGGASRLAGALHLHAGAFAWALVGRWHSLDQAQVGVSLLSLSVLAVVAWLARGRDGAGAGTFVAAALVTLVVRLPLFLWFDPENWEWQLPAVALLAAVAARLTSGEPATRPWARGTAGSLLLASAVALLVAHGPDTWSLRQRRLQRAIEAALAAAGPDAEVLSLGKRADLALMVAGVDFRSLDELNHPTLPVPPGWRSLVKLSVKYGLQSPEPLLLVVDRFVRDGMPDTRAALTAFDQLAQWGQNPRVELLRFEGEVYGLIVR